MIEIEKETIRVGVKVKCGGSHVRFDKVPKVVGLDLGWLSMRDSSRHVCDCAVCFVVACSVGW